MGGVGIGLAVIGLVASFAFTAVYVRAIDEAFAGLPTSPGTSSTSSMLSPDAPRTFELEVTSDDYRKGSALTWRNESGGIDQETTSALPWRKTVTMDPAQGPLIAHIGGSSPVNGKGGAITCTIREDGQILDAQTVQGTYATVSCDAY